MLRGRTYATPQDVFDLAPEILRHRLLLTYDALARDITADHVVQRILATVPATWVSPKPNDAFGAGAPQVLIVATLGPASVTPVRTLLRRAASAARRTTADGSGWASGPPTETVVGTGAHAGTHDQRTPRRRAAR